MMRAAAAPLIVVTNARLWWLLRARVGTTARSKSSATRVTTSWSVIGSLIAGQSGAEAAQQGTNLRLRGFLRANRGSHPGYDEGLEPCQWDPWPVQFKSCTLWRRWCNSSTRGCGPLGSGAEPLRRPVGLWL